MREDMIYKVLNGAHNCGELSKNLVWVPTHYDKEFKAAVADL